MVVVFDYVLAANEFRMKILHSLIITIIIINRFVWHRNVVTSEACALVLGITYCDAWTSENWHLCCAEVYL